MVGRVAGNVEYRQDLGYHFLADAFGDSEGEGIGI